MPAFDDDAVSERAPSAGAARGAASALGLAGLLDEDPHRWRAALDDTYRVLDDVLAGRRPAIVYPAARMGRRAAAGLTALGATVVAFGDRDAALQGGGVDGLPVLSPAEIGDRHRKDAILVASTMFDSTICEDLRARGCEAVVPVGYLNLRLPDVFEAREYHGAGESASDPRNRADIERLHALLADDESRRVFVGRLAFSLSLDKAHLDAIRTPAAIYFDPSVYELGPDHVVVDGGAYVGDTLESFLACSSRRFRSYFAFEPDAMNYAKLTALAASDPTRITTVRAGLARETGTARFAGTAGADSRVLGQAEPGGESVPMVSLDDYFERRPLPSLIKMDIEGAEADALRGAARILGDAAPVLAVSAYHVPSDLWSIPLLIERLMSHCRLYLRHYSREVDDTVCYAIPGR